MRIRPLAALAGFTLTLGILNAAPASAATTWTPPVNLSATGADAEAPELATSVDGRFAVAAWTRDGQM